MSLGKTQVVVALFGASRPVREKLGAALVEEFSRPLCATVDIEMAVKQAAKTMFGLPADIIAWHPERWGDPEELYYGKKINSILRATMKFGESLDQGVWIDRALEYITASPCEYVVLRDGRTLREWELLKKRRSFTLIVVGVLVKKGRTPFPEDEFDMSLRIADADEDMSEHVESVAKWVREVHEEAGSS